MRITPTFIFLLLILLLAACIKNEQDESDPILNLATTANEDQVVFSGGFVSFQIGCTDDVGLMEVRVEADCPMSNWNPTTDMDSAVQVIPTLGETLSMTSALQLVENLISETCMLTVTCIDGEGNESNSESFEFEVRNVFDSSGPLIELKDSFLVDDQLVKGIEIEASTPFKPHVCFLDSSKVDYVRLEVLDEAEVLNQNEYDFSAEDAINITVNDLQLTSPSTIGEYSLRIIATDSLNNTRQGICPIIVIE